jgi:hypothetical protein
MAEHSLLSTLSIVTLVIVVGYAAFRLMQNRKSQEKRGEHPGGIAGPD